VVVHGGRGAGKSSLLAVAAGVRRPDAGAVSLAGRELGSLQSSSLPYVRRNIGYLPPEPPLVREETVLENVRLALLARGLPTDAATAEAGQTLAALGIAALSPRRVRGLSAPERRLTALARAVVGPAPLLVLDEPSAGLDAEDRERVTEVVLEAAAAGAAVLCGTSEDALARSLEERGARLLLLANGRLTGAAWPRLAPAPAIIPAIISVIEGGAARPVTVEPRSRWGQVDVPAREPWRRVDGRGRP
jgi:ABC-type multidrug transport system ATPase subunit